MAIPQRILFFIGFLLTMVGCSKNEVPEPTPNTSSKRVIMAYMVANNNLDEDIRRLASELSAAQFALDRRGVDGTV